MANSKKRLYTLKDAVLSFQHMFAMLGATITVPIVANMSIPMALLSAGVGTIIFYFCAKGKVPVFLGSSFAFLPALAMMLAGYAKGTAEYNARSLAVMLALVAAGLVYVVLSVIIKFVGVNRIKKLFPPIVVGPVIIVIGMNLAGTAFKANIFESTAAPWQAWTTAIVTALTIVLVNALAKPKSFFKVVPILMGFVVGYGYAAILSLCPTPAGYAPLIDFASIFSGDIVVFQQASTIWGFWGAWDGLDGALIGTAMVAIVPIALVTFMEHLGDISANSVVCGQDFMVDPGLHRTILGDGLGTIASALLGGPANTTYGENTAVLAITKNYNPKNLFLAAIFAVILGILVPFGEILGSMPGAVVGGASFILYGMISANGLRALVDGRVNFSDTKNIIVVSITLAVGLGLNAAGMAGHKVLIGSIEISPLAIATLLAIVLNLIIPNTKEETESPDNAIITLTSAPGAEFRENTAETANDENMKAAQDEQ